MIRGRVANVIISFSRDRDDMLLANFERVRGLETMTAIVGPDAEKVLRVILMRRGAWCFS